MALFKKAATPLSPDNYGRFSDWIDRILKDGLPEDIAALSFNLYEGTKRTYDIQLIGSDEFDKDDSDWVSSELFTTGEDICCLPRTKDIEKWEDGLAAIKGIIERYLAEGRYASVLKGYKALGIGFVDGDLELLYLA